MKISIWTGIYHKRPLDKAILKLKKTDWKNFEVSTEHLVRIETSEAPSVMIDKTNETVEKYGLTLHQSHAMLFANIADPDKEKREEDISRIEKHVEISSEIGVSDVVIHPGFDNAAELETLSLINIESIRRIADLCAEKNMRLLIENIPGPYDKSDDLLELISRVDHESVGVVFDTSHANMCGFDIPAEIRNFGSKLWGTHISDNDGSGDQHKIPGWGTIDWFKVVDALKDIDYNGYFNLEVPGARHRIPEITDIKVDLALHAGILLVGGK